MAAALALIVGMLALGQACGRLRWLPEHSAEVLHRFVLLICLPALVLVQLRGLVFDRHLLVLALIPWLWVLFSVVLIHVSAPLLGFSREVKACLLLTLPLGNTAFLGYPMIEALLGHEALKNAVVYDQLGSFLILSIYAVSVATVYREGTRPPLRQVVLRVLTYPAFVALVVGLLPIVWPDFLLVVLKRLADCLVPLVIFAIGLQLRFRLPEGQGRGLLFGLLVKLVLGAAFAFALCVLLRVSPEVLKVATLQAAMPIMVTAGALAIEAKQAPELAAAQVGIGVLLALLWLPLLTYWLG